MSNPNPSPTTRFQPGHIGGPGRAKNWLKPGEIKDYIGKYCRMTMTQLERVKTSETSSVLEVILAGVLHKIAKDPDPAKLEYVLNRTVGRIVEEMKEELDSQQPLSESKRPDGSVHQISLPPIPEPSIEAEPA